MEWTYPLKFHVHWNSTMHEVETWTNESLWQKRQKMVLSQRKPDSIVIFRLAPSWRMFLSYRNQSIDLLCKSMDWFPYDIDLRHERVENYFQETNMLRLMTSSTSFISLWGISKVRFNFTPCQVEKLQGFHFSWVK